VVAVRGVSILADRGTADRGTAERRPPAPEEPRMRVTALLAALNPLRALDTVDAHCDLMCGVYNPAQARIEAESVHQIAVKYHASDDETFRQRCVIIKEERAELVKHHLSVLWTDYFKPEHLEKHPDLHTTFWKAIKAAGEAKKTMDPAAGEELLRQIDAIGDIFWATKGGKPDWMTA
jgi:nickel superoxide dismutase